MKAFAMLVLVGLSMSQAAAAAPAVQLVVSNDPCDLFPCPLPPPPPTSVGSRVPFLLAVVALDAGGSRDASYRGTVSFSSSDPMASLPASYTFTASDAGGKGFTVFLSTLGSQTITGTDNGAPTLSGSLTLNVTASSQGIPTLSTFAIAVLAIALGVVGFLVVRLSNWP